MQNSPQMFSRYLQVSEAISYALMTKQIPYCRYKLKKTQKLFQANFFFFVGFLILPHDIIHQLNYQAFQKPYESHLSLIQIMTDLDPLGQIISTGPNGIITNGNQRMVHNTNRSPLQKYGDKGVNEFKNMELFGKSYIHQMKAQAIDNQVANFVQKAFEIISNNEYSRVIQWSGNGKQFTIKDIEQFEETILPKYFRHRNINSFIRQLNMYGFHKSRKEPTKNIFSHPFFQKDRQDLLAQVRRKLKQDENETPRKSFAEEKSEEKITIYDKPTAQKEEVKPSSSTSIVFKSALCLEKQNLSPFKGLISRSFIMDINPEACLRLRSNSILPDESEQEDDKVSIVEEMNKQRERVNNRTQLFSIVRTSNFLEEFDF